MYRTYDIMMMHRCCAGWLNESRRSTDGTHSSTLLLCCPTHAGMERRMELRELVTTLQKLRRAVVFARRAVCEELDGYDSPVYVSTVPTIVYVCLFYVATSSGSSSMGTSILGSKKSIKSNGGCVWENTMLRVDFRMWCPYPRNPKSVCCFLSRQFNPFLPQ